MKNLIIVTIFGLFCLSGIAQTDVEGTVSDINGVPIPGVTVKIIGVAKGGMTDFDGNYNLSGVAIDATLRFSFIGYQTREVQVDGRSNIDVTLLQSKEQLDEVVVVGYGTVKKKDLTGSVASVQAEKLATTATANFDQALAGRVSGVQVSASDGTPGQGLNITIRGGNSITGDNSPLYVVDGIPLEDFDPGSISTQDIETLDILKDASATAIYGSRAANGVVVINTKNGRTDGKTDVRVSAEHGVSWIPNRLEVLGPYEYVKYQEQAALAKDNYIPQEYTKFFQETFIDPELYRGMEGTSWQDRIFQVAQTQQYNASISGGNSDTNLYFSTEYFDQEGTLINTDFKKIVNNLKFRHKLDKKTRFNGYIRYTRLERGGANISGNEYTSVIRDAIRFRPVEPIIDDGLGEGGLDLFDDSAKYLFNPVQSLNNTDRQDARDIVRGSLRLTHRFMPNLTLQLSGNYQLVNRKSTLFFGRDTQQGTRGPIGINGEVTNRRYQNLSSSNTLTYKENWGDHGLQLLGGLEFQHRQTELASASNGEIPTDLFGIDNLGLGIAPGIPQTFLGRSSLFSYFGRVNYDYKDKYLFTATFRADGSSKFNKDNRWGYFPSFSGAWKISDEDFLKNSSTLSFAKIRAGWGRTGNNRIGNYDAFSQLNTDTGSGYVWGNGEGFIPGAYQSNLGVPNLKWETTDQLNLGLDLGFFDDRLQATVDYYKKNTSDLLLNAEMALHTGFNRVQQNIGEIENEGLEIALNSINIDSEKFKWTSSFNISFNRNKTVALNDGQNAIYTDPDWNFRYSEYQYITQVGQPVGMIYGLEYDRLYQQDDFNYDTGFDSYSLKEGIPDNGTLPVAPGSVKFIDQNGDGTINSQDRKIIGDPHPDHFGGFSNSFEYAGFDLDILFQWSYGFDILNANKAVFEVPDAGRYNGLKGIADMWTPLNTDTDVNAIRYLTTFGKAPDGNQIDDRYIEDGSYIKLKSVSLGYNIPKSIVSNIGMDNVRVHVAAQNLFTWTDYSGYDPDVSVGRYGALTPKLDYSAYPQSTLIMGGIDLTF